MPNGITLITRMLYSDDLTYGPYAENYWHFSYDPLVGLPPFAPAAAAEARLAVRDFWTNDLSTGTSGLQAYLSSSLSGIVQCSYLDWDEIGPPHAGNNIRHDLDNFNVTPNVDSLPNEVATCLTFRCDPYDSIPFRQSFYNRVYLGPLSKIAAYAATGTTGTRPRAAFRDDIVAAYSELQQRLDITGPDFVRHAVFSRKHLSSALVVDGWVDDAWDTQRSRGLDPTSKTHIELV